MLVCLIKTAPIPDKKNLILMLVLAMLKGFL